MYKWVNDICYIDVKWLQSIHFTISYFFQAFPRLKLKVTMATVTCCQYFPSTTQINIRFCNSNNNNRKDQYCYNKWYSNMPHTYFSVSQTVYSSDELHDISRNTERNIIMTYDVTFDVIKPNKTRIFFCPLNIVRHVLFYYHYLSIRMLWWQ